MIIISKVENKVKQSEQNNGKMDIIALKAIIAILKNLKNYINVELTII